MSCSVAFLRAINVGGRRLEMRALRQLFQELGLGEAQTLLQSGNVVFRQRSGTPKLESLLEQATLERLSLEVDYFVRTSRELDEIIEQNPFSAEAKRDPTHLVVMFLKDLPASGQIARLHEILRGPEQAVIRKRQAYIVYPAGIGRSKLTGTLIEKKLGTRGTARNWKRF
jgi:uncharacterized protein (DUF1697 family)